MGLQGLLDAYAQAAQVRRDAWAAGGPSRARRGEWVERAEESRRNKRAAAVGREGEGGAAWLRAICSNVKEAHHSGDFFDVLKPGDFFDVINKLHSWKHVLE